MAVIADLLHLHKHVAGVYLRERVENVRLHAKDISHEPDGRALGASGLAYQSHRQRRTQAAGGIFDTAQRPCPGAENLRHAAYQQKIIPSLHLFRWKGMLFINGQIHPSDRAKKAEPQFQDILADSHLKPF